MKFVASEPRLPQGVHYRGVQLTTGGRRHQSNIYYAKAYLDKKISQTGFCANRYIVNIAKKVANVPMNLLKTIDETGSFDCVEQNIPSLGTKTLAELVSIAERKLGKTFKVTGKAKSGLNLGMNLDKPVSRENAKYTRGA